MIINSGRAANLMVEEKKQTMFEVEPPEKLLIKLELAKNVPVELVFEKQMLRQHEFWMIEEFVTAPDVSIPINFDKDSLPYDLITRARGVAVLESQHMASLSIRVVQKRHLNITLKNLHFLKDAFGENASFKLILSHDGVLTNWKTCEMEIDDSEEKSAETSIQLSEDIDELIAQFGRRKRYRTALGEVSSVSGAFTIQAIWSIKPRPCSNELVENSRRHQKFINAKSFDHTINLVTSEGKTFPVSKGLLAALSEKIEKQLQFLSDENTDARAFQAIKIFSGFKCKDGSYHCLNEDSLIPFVKFIAMNSIGLPLTSPALSLELMMIASYNLFHEMEKSMALILLAQPLDLYNVETSLYLYWFSSLKHEVYEDGPQKRLWELLRVRSLWNLKWVPKYELNSGDTYALILDLFPEKIDRDQFFSLI